MELGKYDLKFLARKSIRVLAEFVAEWAPCGEFEDQAEAPTKYPIWTVFTDGAWCASGAGCAAVITSPSGQTLRYLTTLAFQTTNNVVEYEGTLLGLRQADTLDVKRLIIL